MSIIKLRDAENRVMRSFKMKKAMDDKLNKIAEKTGESKVYVLESLLEFAIKEWELKEAVQIDRLEYLHQPTQYHSGSPDSKTLPAFLLPHRPKNFMVSIEDDSP